MEFNNEINEGAVDKRKQSYIAHKKIADQREKVLEMILKQKKKERVEGGVNLAIKKNLKRVELIYKPKNAA